MVLKGKIIEYLRLGRLFNAEIISLILVLSYILTAYLYGLSYDVRLIIILFIAGITAHVSGSYNNDRMDLEIDLKADYCAHKPLVTGKISLHAAKVIEYSTMVMFIALILLATTIAQTKSASYFFIPGPVSTIFYLLGAMILAKAYNRWNKSNMFINVIGQFYAAFVVLIGMSLVTVYDHVLGLIAIIIGLNGVYLNIVEADIKDIYGDVINVPKSLGIQIIDGKATHIFKFYFVNDVIKFLMFLLILLVLIIEGAPSLFLGLAIVLFVINYGIRVMLFRNLGRGREELKKIIAIQELTAILLISTVFMVVNIWIPLIIILAVIVWLALWNKVLWGTYLRPQV